MEKQLTEKSKHDFCLKTIEGKNKIERDFIELAARLHTIKNGRWFEAGWTSWEEFQMELKLSDATISKLIAIYEKFVLEYKFSATKIAEAGGWTVIAETLPLIHSKTDAERWLGRSSELSLRDVRKEVKEAKTGIQMGDCRHPETYDLRICRGCGERWSLLEGKIKKDVKK